MYTTVAARSVSAHFVEIALRLTQFSSLPLVAEQHCAGIRSECVLHCPNVCLVQVRMSWHVVTVPLEMTFLAVLNYHQQGLLVAAAKYLLTCFLSLLVGFYADRTARLDFLAATAASTAGTSVLKVPPACRHPEAEDACGSGASGSTSSSSMVGRLKSE
jgi:hypothetical protein